MNVIGKLSTGAFVIDIDGVFSVVPDDPENEHRKIIAQLEEEGLIVENIYGLPYGYDPPPPPTIADYENAIQEVVDGSARERNFRDGVTLASYIGSTIPRWAAEAATFVAWRDAVWQYTYQQLEQFQLGTREQPSVADFLTELPVIDWNEQ